MQLRLISSVNCCSRHRFLDIVYTVKRNKLLAHAASHPVFGLYQPQNITDWQQVTIFYSPHSGI